jgi:uncharacterized protein DUF4926
MKRPELFAAVALNIDLPEFRLERGDVGVVVEVYPRDDVEVEFMDGDGETVALQTASDRLLREVPDDEQRQKAKPLPEGTDVAHGTATARVTS